MNMGVSLWGDENVLELALRVYNFVNILNATEFCTLKKAKGEECHVECNSKRSPVSSLVLTMSGVEC